MDPIGLSLDNFDVTARWREREYGSPLDPHGDFYDGTKISSANELITALLKRPTPLVRTFTENLMAYALGRRVEYFDQPTIRAIAKKAEADNYKMSGLHPGHREERYVPHEASRCSRGDRRHARPPLATITSTVEET